MLRFADFYADRRQTIDKPIALPLLRMRARGVKIDTDLKVHIEIIFISIVILSLVGGYTKCLTLWDIRQPFSPVDRQDKGMEKCC